MTPIVRDAAPTRSGQGPEAPQAFLPTPERLAQFLERNHDEVRAQMQSVRGRKQLIEDILGHEDHLKDVYNGRYNRERTQELIHFAGSVLEKEPEVQAQKLESMLDSAHQTLEWKSRYMEQVRSPEKKGLFRRAWDAIKGFPKKHPIVTTVLLLAAAAGAVAGGFYLTGQWELLLSKLGLSKILGGAEAVSELIPPTAPTEMLPGGGIFEVPPPAIPPGRVPGLGTPL